MSDLSLGLEIIIVRNAVRGGNVFSHVCLSVILSVHKGESHVTTEDPFKFVHLRTTSAPRHVQTCSLVVKIFIGKQAVGLRLKDPLVRILLPLFGPFHACHL